MSATHPDRSFDSGENHLKPALVAVAMFIVAVAISLLFFGLPH